eukprot:1057003-Amphidinium_carterae.1
MDQIARAEPVDHQTSGGSGAMAVAVLSSASAQEKSDVRESRPVSVGKRNLEDLGPPPGLTDQ